MAQQNLCNLKTQEETKMNKLITTIAAIAMLAVSGSAFAQLSDGDKVNVLCISQHMNSGQLGHVQMINVDTPPYGVQNINAVTNHNISSGAIQAPINLKNRQHFLIQAQAREDGNEAWNRISFEDYDRSNAIYTREFAIKADCTIDYRVSDGGWSSEGGLAFERNDYTMLAADGSIFMSITIEDPRCGGPGPAGAAGADGAAGAAGDSGADGAAGADGAQGDSGAAGADGADGDDAPCVDCSILSDAVVDFTCKMMAANPPTSVPAFDDYVDAIVNTLTLTTNVCTDKAQCITDIKAVINDLK